MARTRRTLTVADGGKPERKWRLTPLRKLQAAQLVVDEGISPAEAAKKFGRHPHVDEVRGWADDYRNLDKTMFLAKYGNKKVTADGRLQSGFTYDRLPVMLRQEIVRLRTLKSQMEDQLAAVSKQLEKAEKHLAFVESETPPV